MSGALQLGRFSELRKFFASRPGRPRVLGVSGGATSGVMAALSDDDAMMAFENTGEEHPRTYDFLEQLADALGKSIVWLEYRSPIARGAAPKHARFAIVNTRTADRSGGPFDALLEDLAAYRATKGLGPIAPWARSRICTAYLKGRTQDRWLASLGITTRDECSGLRADEPDRVKNWEWRTNRTVNHLAPLNDAGITKPDVADFWSMQSFRLGLAEHDGNCRGCFLKDQSDLSRAMASMSHEEAHRWIVRERRYDSFGGRKFAGYATLLDEAAARRDIEQDIRDGNAAPENRHNLEPNRFRLVVIQERKRLAGEVVPFSCACEGSDTLVAMNDEQEEAYIESLPSDAA